jgi:ubiquinone/menaquinone biosynthesis C-methylase UbiE
MTKSRIEYPGTVIHESDPENHFRFQDIGLREYYHDVIRKIPGLKGFEGKALHIGCGTAAFENLLCDKLEFARFYGLEQSPTLVRIGEAISSRFKYADRILLRVWEDEFLPFPDNEFDLVISLSSLHQWRNPEKTFTDIARVLKDEGTIFISDFQRKRFFMPFYFFAQKIGSSFGKEIGQNLMAAYRASYTTKQVAEILEKLGLDTWEVEKNGRWFDIISPPSEHNDSDSGLLTDSETTVNRN